MHDVVAIQDPTGHPRRWSKTGKIIEALDHDSYMVTKRNGQFLRKLGLYQADTDIFDPMPPLTTPPGQIGLILYRCNGVTFFSEFFKLI